MKKESGMRRETFTVFTGLAPSHTKKWTEGRETSRGGNMPARAINRPACGIVGICTCRCGWCPPPPARRTRRGTTYRTSRRRSSTSIRPSAADMYSRARPRGRSGAWPAPADAASWPPAAAAARDAPRCAACGRTAPPTLATTRPRRTTCAGPSGRVAGPLRPLAHDPPQRAHVASWAASTSTKSSVGGASS